VQWILLWADEMLRKAGQKGDFLKAKNQLVSALGAIVGSLLAAIVGGVFGRRITCFFLCLTSLGACQWLFNGVHQFDGLFLVVTGLVSCFTASFYGWLPLCFPEIFPTRARATGQGLAFNFGWIIAAIGVLHMANLMRFSDGSYPKAGATIALICILGMALIWLAPETNGRPLPD